MRKGKIMFLDLKNNELIFSQIPNRKEFTEDLKAKKEIKFREYKNKFYISLAHFQAVREVLSQKYKGKIGFSISYEQFAAKFVLNKNPITIKWYPSMCYVEGQGIPWHMVIPSTSYFDKKAKNSPQYGKSWSGYTHLFNVTKGSFPAGLLERIIEALIKEQIPYSVSRAFEYPAPYLDLSPTFAFTPTEDQIAAVDALAKHNNGIGKLPTGFGKTSFVASSLIAKKGVRSLFLANQRVLTDDAKSDFDSVFAGNFVKIGMIGDGVYDPGDITVASIQTIASALKPPTEKEYQLAKYQLDLAKTRLTYTTDEEHRKECLHDIKKCTQKCKSIEKKMQRHEEILAFLKTIDLFVVDEAQVLGTDQWNTFLHLCPAPYRYTLSATDTRTDGGRIQIVAATGERRFESSAAEQIEKGRLSEFLGHFVKFDHKMDPDLTRDLTMDYHQAYDLFIVHNEKRNQHLCAKTIEWAKDYCVLALVTRKEHGEIVRRMLIEMGLPETECFYIDGDTPKKERKETIEAFRRSEFRVLLGTSIFDVGFNAKNAAKLVRFNAGGSEVREPQRAGRTVRLREDGSIGESYDVLDLNVPFFEAQGWKRRKYLQDEFGKERVKILPTIIEGDLNIVALQEIVAAIPEETDRLKGEEIIKSLQFSVEDYDNVPNDLNETEFEPELESLLQELTYKGE